MRHLDTLAEVVSNKIADQVERNKVLSVNILDSTGGGSRELKRQREMQERGNVDVVSGLPHHLFFARVLCYVNTRTTII